MERLQKVMADAGIASRRHCEEMITEGKVKVNGTVVNKLPVMVEPDHDVILVEGRKLRFSPKVYYLLNKPKKVICTNIDPQGRVRAIDMLPPAVKQRVYPVGRLDTDSQGLIILTNDGDLANQLTHPSYGVTKTYVCEIASKIDGNDIEKLKKGFYVLYRGRVTMDRVKILKRGLHGSVIEITLKEGRNRQIRRMLSKLGHKVKKLTRVKIGPIDDRGLGVGKCRPLTNKEVEQLRKIIEKNKAKEKETKTERKTASGPKTKKTTKKVARNTSTKNVAQKPKTDKPKRRIIVS
ncbi:MAG: rRNA pseudouridine synthase [Phycisphaerae bacterium]|nr:rRNA pseudouridine synthase [Phycisphaerae bacterium]